MATTTNYSWTTPDDTDLVKDGAAAIRTLGSSADTTVKDLNPGTTAGDIDYYTSSTAKARVAIGTAGQVLQVNAGATAPEWATAAGGGEVTYTLLNAGGTALTGAQTITISGIGGYDSYFILVINASSASANSEIIVRPNGDATTTNYYMAGLTNTPTTSYTIGTFASNASYQSNANSIALGKTASDAASQARGSFIFWGGKSTGIKAWQSAGAGDNYGGAQQWNQTVRNGLFNLTSVITSFDIRSSTGNWDNGTVYVFGGSI
jgi:hypothetical protein